MMSSLHSPGSQWKALLRQAETTLLFVKAASPEASGGAQRT
jgi:hypothetical protein